MKDINRDSPLPDHFGDVLIDGQLHNGYQDVETQYCPLMALMHADGYLRIVGDIEGGFVEIRVPYRVLVAAGWSTNP